MWDAGRQQVGEELYTIEAEFVTEHLTVWGELRSPEGRLSDHLNSSATSVEIKPFAVTRVFGEGPVDLAGFHAHISKAHLLFIVPITEPDNRSNGYGGGWTRTMTKECWAAFGRYVLSGKAHVEAGWDPMLMLRSLAQKQFIPFTEVTITNPDGSTRQHATAIVNREALELLALKDL
jgi:hypothetical protein